MFIPIHKLHFITFRDFPSQETRDKKTRYMTIKKLQKVCKMQGRGRGLDIRRLTLARKVRDTEKKLLLSSFLCIINEAAAAGNQ